jgi:uncharacterized protein (TIGR00255 family)
MISSMTGFSFQEIKINVGSLVIELRSLNSRFFECQLRASEELRLLEPKMRDMISQKIVRGKVDCRVFIKSVDQSDLIKKPINEKNLKNLISKIESISKHLKNPSSLNPMTLYQFLMNERPSLNSSKMEKDLLIYLKKGLDRLCQDRKREGTKISSVISKNLQLVERQVGLIKKTMPKALKQNEKKLLNKLKDSLINASDERVQQELLFFIQKTDVTEEIDRLEAHIKEMKRLLKLNEPVGKKMDFLMQEFNREANTIGSKAADVLISKASVDLKVLIEQIREQVQNIQ